MAKVPIKIKSLVGKKVRLISNRGEWSGVGTLLAIDQGFVGFNRDSDDLTYWLNAKDVMGISDRLEGTDDKP